LLDAVQGEADHFVAGVNRAAAVLQVKLGDGDRLKIGGDEIALVIAQRKLRALVPVFARERAEFDR